MFLGNISKGIRVDNIKKRLSGHVNYFSADKNDIDVSTIMQIHICLMKKHNIK